MRFLRFRLHKIVPVIALIGLTLIALHQVPSTPALAQDNVTTTLPPVDHLAQQAYWAQRRGPVTAAQYQAARQQAQHLPRASSLPPVARTASQGLSGSSSPASGSWTSIGPSPINSVYGGGNSSGRIAALAIDPTTAGDTTIIYIGTADGGVWKSYNNGGAWIPLTDSQSTLASGAIVIDPNDHNTIYVGTGEPNQSRDSYKGLGVLKSTDGGTNWTQLVGPDQLNPFGTRNSAISRIAIDPKTGTVFVASTLGLYTWNNSDATWKSVADVPQVQVDDLAINTTTTPSTLYAVIRHNGLYRSTDGGQIWVSQMNGLPVGTTWDRSVIALAPVPVPVNTAQQYGALPLSFIANAGQVDSTVRYQVRNSQGTLSFASDGVTLELPVLSSETNQPVIPRRDARNPAVSAVKSTAKIGIRLAFDGANPSTVIDGTDQLPGNANFFIGDNATQWHTNVPTYSTVVYHNLYPGVDLSYTGHLGLLKGTYAVAAGVDLAVIRWRYDGANNVSLDPATGNVKISAPSGVTLTEQVPIAWQTQDGVQKAVAIGYQINNDGSVQFSPGSYNPQIPLTIDPGLVYSSYLGGNGNDWGLAIAVDATGNAYVTGYTSSSDFPVTPGVYSTNILAFGYVSKLNAAGNALIYSTYVGGNPFGVAVKNGDVYITGRVDGPGFATTPGAFQSVYGGDHYFTGDAFMSELDSTGSTLLYSTYLGGNQQDEGNAIGVDGNGNVYITGFTSSTNFPVTPGAIQTGYGPGSPTYNADVFVSKFNPSASGTASLVYSTFLGSGSYDDGEGIAVDATGNAYITGSAGSTNFPTTSGVLQTVCTGSNAFVSKLNPTGNALIYSTCLGNSAAVTGYGIGVDGSGNAYVTGTVYAEGNFPITPGAYQTSFGGGYDAFVSKLNATGSDLVYSTYLGGGSVDYGQAIAINASGEAYVTGYTGSDNFPTKGSPFQPNFGGQFDAFVSKLDVTGTTLLYSSFLGGSLFDAGYGIAVDSVGNAYVTGATSSIDFPTTSGAVQTTYGGSQHDAFVSKFALPDSSVTSSTLYLVISNGTYVYHNDIIHPRYDGGYYSNDGGNNWQPMQSLNNNFAGAQASYALELAVDPLDPKLVYGGGLDVAYTPDAQAGNGNWQPISDWASSTSLHADQHNMAFAPNCTKSPCPAYFVNDGGIYFSANPGVNSTYKNLNNAPLSITEFTGGDLGANFNSTPLALGGSQDNGTERYTGNPAWTETRGGDGGFTQIDQTNSSYMYTEYTRGQVLQSTDAGQTFKCIDPLNRSPDCNYVSNQPDPGTLFYAPLVLDRQDENHLVIGAKFAVYETNNAQRWDIFGGLAWHQSSQQFASAVSAIAISSTNSAVIYAGLSDGTMYRTINANRDATASYTLLSPPVPNLDSKHPSYISSIALDPHDGSNKTVFVTTSATNTSGAGIFKSTDAGKNWIPIMGTGPYPLPAYPINTSVVYYSGNTRVIVVGTDYGVYFTTNDGGLWQSLMTGLPNVPVVQLALDKNLTTLAAFTHGRSAWILAVPTIVPPPTNTPSPTATATSKPLLDGPDTIGIFRNGTFYLRSANSTGFADLTVAFNPAALGYPVVGDWNGMGVDNVGVFDQTNGRFSLCTVNDTVQCANPANVQQIVLGFPGDVPLAGRWQPTSTKAGIGVFRPSNGLIYLKNSLTTGFADYTMVLGIPGDVGLAGDWNNKGYDSPGVYRPSTITFFLSNQVTNGSVYGDIALQYGFPSDAPVVGDWTGIGNDGVGLFRPTNGYTYLRNTLTTGYADITFVYGVAGDIPVAGHWQVTYPTIPNLGRLIVPGAPSTLTPTATRSAPIRTTQPSNFDG